MQHCPQAPLKVGAEPLARRPFRCKQAMATSIGQASRAAAAAAPPRAQPCRAPGAWTPSGRQGREAPAKRQPGRLQAAGEAAAAMTAAAAPAAPAPPAPPAVPSSPLLYSGVIFDMDGEGSIKPALTLTLMCLPGQAPLCPACPAFDAARAAAPAAARGPASASLVQPTACDMVCMQARSRCPTLTT